MLVRQAAASLPRLATGRLLLRPFEPSDAPRVQRYAGEPDVALMTSNIPHPYEDGAAEAWIASHAEALAKGRLYPFAVELPGEGVIGACGLRVEAGQGRGELGYWVGRPWWGNGYMPEAARAVLGFGFGTLGLRRIFAHHLGGNDASGRVMEKLGMRREGVLRAHELHRGERPVDMVVWGILAEEFGGDDGGGPGDVA
jgi:[ribosomal protein S5]-alanine N-acetyltransferase